jgi:HSP20 family protein
MFKNLIPGRKHPEKESALADPAREGGSISQFIDSIFDRFPGSTFSSGWGCEVKDSDNEIIVRAEAPGFEPDEIEIKMSGNQLVLEAEHREGQDGKGSSFHYGKFYRSITMPNGIELDNINAEYRNGVLEVHLPKGAEANVRRIPVKVT